MSLYFRDRSVTVSFCPLLSSCLSQSSAFPCLSCAFPSVLPPPPTPPYYCMRACLSFSNTSLCSFDLLCASLGLFESISHLICPTLTGFTCVFKISLLQLSVISSTLPVYHQCCCSRFWLSGLALWIKFDCLQLWTPFATLWFRIMYLLCCFWLLPSEYMWACECMRFFFSPSFKVCMCVLAETSDCWVADLNRFPRLDWMILSQDSSLWTNSWEQPRSSPGQTQQLAVMLLIALCVSV